MSSTPAMAGGAAISAVVEELLKPGEVTPSLVRRALRRARRLGLYWRILTPLERALLEVAAALRVRRYRSPRVKAILARLVARIEANTVRGVVLSLGLSRAIALSRGRHPLAGGLGGLLEWARARLSYIRYLGRSLLAVINYYAHVTGYT